MNISKTQCSPIMGPGGHNDYEWAMQKNEISEQPINKSTYKGTTKSTREV